MPAGLKNKNPSNAEKQATLLLHHTITHRLPNSIRKYHHIHTHRASSMSFPKIPAKQQRPFIKLVNKILKAKTTNPKADTTNLEAQIDQLVYKLYGLTEEEVMFVEGKG